MKYTFDDILIVPEFSDINSRSEVDLTTNLGRGLKLSLPVISSNMDTITDIEMCKVMSVSGGIGCFHRFCDKEKSLQVMKETCGIISFGLGEKERERVAYLVEHGASRFCLDVAHGAQEQVVNAVRSFKMLYPEKWLMVGNFGSPISVVGFLNSLKIDSVNEDAFYPDAIKIGIGPGSACTTRIKTGVGYPQLSAISDIVSELRFFKNVPKIIADGGIRTPGDIAKALACGAHAVMLGGMLAGTDETPGEIIKSNSHYKGQDPFIYLDHKVYRGSASKESYDDQNKDWACAEGESFTVPYKGPVKNVLDDIRGGLQSAFTYVGARCLEEFQEKSEFIIVSSNARIEGTAHGKKI